MARSAESAAREAKIAELKRLIKAGTYETLEMLEDAVDTLLWSEQDHLHTAHHSAACNPGRNNTPAANRAPRERELAQKFTR